MHFFMTKVCRNVSRSRKQLNTVETVDSKRIRAIRLLLPTRKLDLAKRPLVCRGAQEVVEVPKARLDDDPLTAHQQLDSLQTNIGVYSKERNLQARQ